VFLRKMQPPWGNITMFLRKILLLLNKSCFREMFFLKTNVLNYPHGTWFYSLKDATSLEKWLCSSRNQVIEEFLSYCQRKWLCASRNQVVEEYLFIFPKEMVVCFKKSSC
jgi:hypothetical protein